MNGDKVNPGVIMFILSMASTHYQMDSLPEVPWSSDAILRFTSTTLEDLYKTGQDTAVNYMHAQKLLEILESALNDLRGAN